MTRVSQYPLSTTSTLLPFACATLPPPQCLGVSLFPLPIHLPLLSWFLEKIQNLATAPPLSTFWAGLAVGHSEGLEEHWLPSLCFLDREVQGPACFPAPTLSVALPNWVPSFRNQSSHTCLPSYPGGGELSLAQFFPILGNCSLPGRSPCQAPRVTGVSPSFPPPLSLRRPIPARLPIIPSDSILGVVIGNGAMQTNI